MRPSYQKIVPEDNNYDAEDAIKTVLETPANSGTTLIVPKNKVNDFNKVPSSIDS